MPRCLMAKKWKQVANRKLPLRVPDSSATTKDILISEPKILFNVQQNNEVTNLPTSNKSNKKPSSTISNKLLDAMPTQAVTANERPLLVPPSPTEGTTAPSSPPSWLPMPTAGYLKESTPPVSINTVTNDDCNMTNMDYESTFLIRTKSHSYRFNYLNSSKSRDLYRPYCLPECIAAVNQEKLRLQSVCSTIFERKPEDLTTAHAILDLSSSSPLLPPTPPSSASVSPNSTSLTQFELQECSSNSGKELPVLLTAKSNNKVLPNQEITQVDTTASLAKPIDESSDADCVSTQQEFNTCSSALGPCEKTVSYAYDSFVVSDGRSKKRQNRSSRVGADIEDDIAAQSKLINESDSDSRSATDSKTRYVCSECGKNYATSSNLSRHKQTHRSLDSQSAKRCSTCGKAYVSMPALAMHILTHNLHHRCEVCGKAFSRPWLLQGHIRSHTGEKPYLCGCGKAFADRSNLRAHLQTHSSAKNYTCKRCHKSFALKSYLNKHYDSACFKECQSLSGAESSESSCGCDPPVTNSFLNNSRSSVPPAEVTVEVTTSRVLS